MSALRLRQYLAGLLVCFGAMSAGHVIAATAEDQNALRTAMAEIDQADQRYRNDDFSIRPALTHGIEAIERLLRGDLLDARSVMIARYYRGLANELLNDLRRKQGMPIDQSLAHQSIDDFDYMLKAGKDIGATDDWLANLQYRAGSVAFMQVKDVALAFNYWRSCAESEHAGCMNVVAHAEMTGMNGQSVNLKHALALHKRIFNTGTAFTCAGAFSGQTVAEMNFFLNIRDEGDDPLVWIHKSIGLLNDYAERHDGQDPCGRANFEIIEYLLRLSTGARDDAPLHGILRRKEGQPNRAIAQFLLGQVDDDAVNKAIHSVPLRYVQCSAHFYMFWNGKLNNQPELAESHFRAMTEMSDEDCGTEMLFARAYQP